jgi:hypothetical protein
MPVIPRAVRRKGNSAHSELCSAHVEQWRVLSGVSFDELLMGLAKPPPPLVVAELLVGLQRRCRIKAIKTSDAVLRALYKDV